MNKALAQYVNELLTDRFRELQERRLDKDYDMDKELQEATEHELSVIYQVQKSMDYIEEEYI